MRKFLFNKLVRDKISSNIIKNGGNVKERILTDEEYLNYLKLKLIEESKEVNETSVDKLHKEIADIYEIIDAIKDNFNIKDVDIKETRIKKK